MLPLLAIAALAGLAKSELVDRPAEERKRTLAAKTEALSPWTGLHGQPVKDTDTLGTVMQYGMTGAQIDQNLAEQEAAAKNNPWAAKNKTPGMNPWAPPPPTPGTGYVGNKTNYYEG